MSKSKFDSYKSTIYNGLREGKSRQTIANELGEPVSSLKTWLAAQKDVPPTPDRPVHGKVANKLLAEIDENDLLRSENASLKQRLRKERKADVIEERLLDAVEEAVRTTPSILPVSVEKLWTPGDEDAHNLLIAPFSDTHAGETVDLEALDGANEYNWSIMEDRVARWVDAVISHADHYTDPISRVLMPALGDMVSGDIHEELETTNEFPIAEQCWKFAHVMAQAAIRLAERFPQVDVCGVPGNHPRLKKTPANKQVFNNFDWLAYKIVGILLEPYANISCEFPRAGQQVVKIGDKNLYIFHGDGILSNMPGVPWGGVMRRADNIKKDYANRGIIIDYFLLGHYHQANAVQNIWMNGAIKGPDEFSKKRFGSSESARQLLINFNERAGRVNGVHYIDLQETR